MAADFLKRLVPEGVRRVARRVRQSASFARGLAWGGGHAWSAGAAGAAGAAVEPTAPGRLERYYGGVEEGPGVWKWQQYFDAYERHLSKFVGREPQMIGRPSRELPEARLAIVPTPGRLSRRRPLDQAGGVFGRADEDVEKIGKRHADPGLDHLFRFRVAPQDEMVEVGQIARGRRAIARGFRAIVRDDVAGCGGPGGFASLVRNQGAPVGFVLRPVASRFVIHETDLSAISVLAPQPMRLLLRPAAARVFKVIAGNRPDGDCRWPVRGRNVQSPASPRERRACRGSQLRIAKARPCERAPSRAFPVRSAPTA